MKISNVTVTSKQNFIEKYHRLMKNLYHQNCSSKNEGDINRVSEISKYIVYTASSYCNQLWIFHLSNKIFRKHLKLYIIQPISVSSNIQQLLSKISHFVLFSQAHLEITLKAKTFEKIYFTRFY